MNTDDGRPLTGQPAGGPLDPSPTVSALSGAHQAQDGWIEWNGGEEKPFPGDPLVDVRFRPLEGEAPGEDTVLGIHASKVSWDGVNGWKHYGTAGDIIAYRVVTP